MSSQESFSDHVKKRYSEAAIQLQVNNSSACTTEDCCTGYSKQSSIPSLGSSGNLLSFAKPKSGEVIVDLGSGPGHDLLSASEAVGPEGHLYGIDFTDEMLEFARKNAKEQAVPNASFIKGDITAVPLEDGIANLVLSNCVINLVEEKQKVFNEAYRLLKPQGRMIFSDLVLDNPEDSTRLNTENMCGCIGGGKSKQSYVNGLKTAGFTDIIVHEEGRYELKVNDGVVVYYSLLFEATK